MTIGSSMSSGRIIAEDPKSPIEDEEIMDEEIPSGKIANSEKLNLQEQFFSDLKKIMDVKYLKIIFSLNIFASH